MEREEVDSDSILYDKIKKTTVYWMNKEYSTDTLGNAFDDYGKFIGVWVSFKEEEEEEEEEED